MRQDCTDLTLVLDRSGSMNAIRGDVVGGVNHFLTEQRAAPGDARITLVQFDDQYEPVYTDKPIQDAPHLTLETFVPRGWTALLDAVGRTIVSMGARLEAMPEDQRPGKVVFVVMTDGHENHSQEYTFPKIREMITHQQERYQWQFVFLGANMDALDVAKQMGVPQAQAITFAANAQGTQASYRSLATNVRQYRAGAQSVGWSDEDREDQRKAGA